MLISPFATHTKYLIMLNACLFLLLIRCITKDEAMRGGYVAEVLSSIV
jgi:hypothetical protein